MTVGRLVVQLRESRPNWSVPDRSLEAITAAASKFEVVVIDAPADGRGDGGAPDPRVLDAIPGAEVFLGFGFPQALFEAARRHAPGLRWVHSASAGVGAALHPAMIESPILLTNSAGIHAEPIADTVLAMILHFVRGLDHAVRGQARGEWWTAPFEDPRVPIRELSECVVGVIGLGGIGQAVARRCTALGMRVVGTRRRAETPVPGVDRVLPPESLDELLRESHIVVLCVPGTDATTALIDRDRIAHMREDAILINVGRGSAVDEGALIDALRQGRIRGAALDVFATEPLPSDSPLWGLDHLLITPHVTPVTSRFWERQTALILENLRRYTEGEPLLNLVDKRAGY